MDSRPLYFYRIPTGAGLGLYNTILPSILPFLPSLSPSFPLFGSFRLLLRSASGALLGGLRPQGVLILGGSRTPATPARPARHHLLQRDGRTDSHDQPTSPLLTPGRSRTWTSTPLHPLTGPPSRRALTYRPSQATPSRQLLLRPIFDGVPDSCGYGKQSCSSQGHRFQFPSSSKYCCRESERRTIPGSVKFTDDTAP